MLVTTPHKTGVCHDNCDLAITRSQKSIEKRPRKCPNCPGETFQRWGRAARNVHDTHIKQVDVIDIDVAYTILYFAIIGKDRSASANRTSSGVGSA